jgi:hypothetical protein
VVAELEKMNNEATLFGPRTFSKDLHHQNQGRYLIVDTEGGKAERGRSVDDFGEDPGRLPGLEIAGDAARQVPAFGSLVSMGRSR